MFFNYIFIDLLFLKKKKFRKIIYNLVLSFFNNRLFVNFLNFNKKKNYLFISNGFFIKFYEKKKSLKKNKMIKLLIAKHLRKILLILQIKNLILRVKNNPTFLVEFLSLLNFPISHKFVNPLSQKIIEEKKKFFTIIKFFYFIFLESFNFSKNKIRKKGRIKRKIIRKLFIKDRITD